MPVYNSGTSFGSLIGAVLQSVGVISTTYFIGDPMNKELEFKFSRTVHFQGRNGYFKSEGLYICEVEEVKKTDDHFRIVPVTSKEALGNCWIEVPKKDLVRLIDELNIMLLK